MDNTTLSETSIQDICTVLREALCAAEEVWRTGDLAAMEDTLQAVSRRLCGTVLEQVCAVRAAQPAALPPCPACGGRLRRVAGTRPR